MSRNTMPPQHDQHILTTTSKGTAMTSNSTITGHAPDIAQTPATAAPMAELTAANREVAYHLDLAARLRAAATDDTSYFTAMVAKSLLLEAARHLEEGGAPLKASDTPSKTAQIDAGEANDARP